MSTGWEYRKRSRYAAKIAISGAKTSPLVLTSPESLLGVSIIGIRARQAFHSAFPLADRPPQSVEHLRFLCDPV